MEDKAQQESLIQSIIGDVFLKIVDYSGVLLRIVFDKDDLRNVPRIMGQSSVEGYIERDITYEYHKYDKCFILKIFLSVRKMKDGM